MYLYLAGMACTVAQCDPVRPLHLSFKGPKRPLFWQEWPEMAFLSFIYLPHGEESRGFAGFSYPSALLRLQNMGLSSNGVLLRTSGGVLHTIYCWHGWQHHMHVTVRDSWNACCVV